MTRRTPASRLVLALVIALAAIWFFAPAASSGGQGNDLRKAIAAQERHTAKLLEKRGVVGTAVGYNSEGRTSVAVLTVAQGVKGIPRTLDGVPVAVRVTGQITALHHSPGHGGGPPDGGSSGGKIDPKIRFTRPVPIGVSTGNVGECSAGTLGARVKKGGEVYALSNNHVFALENTAPLGSEVLQPGRFDTGCAIDSNDVIGTLSDFEPIVFSSSANNTVDAAIALSSTANLGNATPSNGYGTPSSAIAAAFVGQNLQKYARTTSLTTGEVTLVNATVLIGYDSGTARFVGQIIVEGRKPVTKPGDSGSLFVTNNSGLNPVGLSFAGTSDGKLAVANPIGSVLAALGISIDGT